jgi:hypothetical protein
MFREPGHLSDEDILVVLDGESSRGLARSAQAHLAACWECRSRMGELEGTIEAFVSLHRRALDPELPDPKGPTALLRARLGQAAAEKSNFASSPFLRLPVFARAFAWLCAAVLVAGLGGLLFFKHPQPHLLTLANRTVPDPRLTPGATRPVSLEDVCSMPHEEVMRDVSGSLRQQVFREYGIVNPRAEDYEVDYLIAPGLGGTEDIRNLWPEPSTSSAWNAHKKDALEERLHQLVCNGELDLNTAQKAIATDWITAYEKYCKPDTFAGTPVARPEGQASEEVGANRFLAVSPKQVPGVPHLARFSRDVGYRGTPPQADDGSRRSITGVVLSLDRIRRWRRS